MVTLKQCKDFKVRLSNDLIRDVHEYDAHHYRVEGMEIRPTIVDGCVTLSMGSYYDERMEHPEVHVVQGTHFSSDIPFIFNGEPFDACFDDLDEALDYFLTHARILMDGCHLLDW